MPPYLWRVLTNNHQHLPPVEAVSPSWESHKEVDDIVSEATFLSLRRQLESPPPVKEPMKCWWNDQLLVCVVSQHYI